MLFRRGLVNRRRKTHGEKKRSPWLPRLSSTLGVSEPYVVDIRAGRRVPHPRHWQTLAGLVGIEPKMS